MVIELRANSAWSLQWQCPHPQLPALLRLSGSDLRTSKEWKLALEHRQVSGPLFCRGHGAAYLSSHGSRGCDWGLEFSGAGTTSGLRVQSLEHPGYSPTSGAMPCCSSPRGRFWLLFHTPHGGNWPTSTEWPPTSCFLSCFPSSLGGSSSYRPAPASRPFPPCNACRAPTTKEGPDFPMWNTRPGALYRWLAGDSTSWGSTPIMDETGHQCTTLKSVDAAVQAHWVQGVWRMHESVDVPSSWAAFCASCFFAHIPHLDAGPCCSGHCAGEIVSWCPWDSVWPNGSPYQTTSCRWKLGARGL